MAAIAAGEDWNRQKSTLASQRIRQTGHPPAVSAVIPLTIREMPTLPGGCGTIERVSGFWSICRNRKLCTFSAQAISHYSSKSGTLLPQQLCCLNHAAKLITHMRENQDREGRQNSDHLLSGKPVHFWPHLRRRDSPQETKVCGLIIQSSCVMKLNIKHLQH